MFPGARATENFGEHLLPVVAGGRRLDHAESDERGYRRAVSLFEGTVPPGGGPPHVEHREDESFYVLEGEFEILVGEDTISAGAGSCVHVPSATLHTFKNVGTSPSKVLGVLTPEGFEKFFPRSGRASGGGVLCAGG